MTSTCPSCSRTYSRLDNLKRHEKYSCLAKNHKQHERDFHQIAKVPGGLRTMQASNRLIDNDRKAIRRKHKIFKPDEKQAIQEAWKPQFSPRKNLACITQKSKDEAEPLVKKQKVEAEEEFSQEDNSPSVITKNNADDKDVNEDDNDDDYEDDDAESDLSSEYEIEAKTEAEMLDYWEDPNKLVDRLRFLLQPQVAGNINNAYEIISIVNEMREAGIIE